MSLLVEKRVLLPEIDSFSSLLGCIFKIRFCSMNQFPVNQERIFIDNMFSSD